jgi:hypothetical protein
MVGTAGLSLPPPGIAHWATPAGVLWATLLAGVLWATLATLSFSRRNGLAKTNDERLPCPLHHK